MRQRTSVTVAIFREPPINCSTGCHCELGEAILLNKLTGSSTMKNRMLSFSGVPLKKHLLFKSRDLDETQDKIQKIFNRHSLTLSSSKQQGINTVLHHAALDNISISYLKYGAEACIKPQNIPFYLIEMPLSGYSKVCYEKRTLVTRPGMAFVAGPTTKFQKEWSSDCTKIIVKINREAIEHYLSTILQKSLKYPILFEPGMSLKSPSSQLWCKQIRILIEELENPESIINTFSSSAGAHFEQLLMWTILHTQPNNYLNELTANRSSVAPRFVRLAEEYIDTHCQEKITLADLIGVTNVTATTLLNGFRQHKGMSPMKYLKSVRLDRVYTELSNADHNTSVTDTALDWGFTQLGRFSGEYKERFGESPSETLKKSTLDIPG